MLFPPDIKSAIGIQVFRLVPMLVKQFLESRPFLAGFSRTSSRKKEVFEVLSYSWMATAHEEALGITKYANKLDNVELFFSKCATTLAREEFQVICQLPWYKG